MIMTIIAILVGLWLLGLVINIGGDIIHLLLVAAAIVFVYNRLVGRRDRV